MAKTDSELLQEFKERFKDAEEASSKLHAQFKRDMRFRYGEQWDDQDLAKRKQRGRPCLVFNRINPTIRQITNDQRQNSPAPEVTPVDDKGDIKTAEVIQGMIRFILSNSNAKSAFSTGFEHAVTGGFGYWRVLTEYADDNSFDQDIKIKRIINPGSVNFDPNSVEIDGSDAEWAFIDDEMSKEKYKRIFPKSELASMDSWGNSDNPFVLNDKTVRIAEHFYSEYTPKKLLLLSDGSAVLEDELDRELLQHNKITVEEGKSRVIQVRSIKWVKTNGVDILDRTDWLGKWIPIIPTYGEEFYLDGKINRRGMVADGRDPQMAFNALESSTIEAIALAPKAPWLVTKENIEGFKNIWDNSFDNLPYLPFNIDNAGHVPSRNSVEPPIMALSQASMMMSENLKASTGVFDAALGAKSNEVSGVAIGRRTMQAQTSNYHYQDHLNASLSHTGRILVDLIPKIYDARRAVRILGNEDDVKTVLVNVRDPETGGMIYDLSAGTYDVRMQTGPSYSTKRQEAAASMMELSKNSQQFMAVAGDLAVKAMDFPHSQEIAERIRRTIPPNILGEQGQQQIPPEVQGQIAQMQQVIQAQQAELEKAKNPIITKQMDNESKERIELLKAETELEIKKMELQANVGDLQAAFQTITSQIHQLNMQMAQLSQPSLPPMPGGPGFGGPIPQEQFSNDGGQPLGPPGQPDPSQFAYQEPFNPTGGLTPG